MSKSGIPNEGGKNMRILLPVEINREFYWKFMKYAVGKEFFFWILKHLSSWIFVFCGIGVFFNKCVFIMSWNKIAFYYILKHDAERNMGFMLLILAKFFIWCNQTYFWMFWSVWSIGFSQKLRTIIMDLNILSVNW